MPDHITDFTASVLRTLPADQVAQRIAERWQQSVAAMDGEPRPVIPTGSPLAATGTLYLSLGPEPRAKHL